MKVKVTKADIRKGRMQARTDANCPVWYALQRSLRNLTSEDVSKLCIPSVHYAKIPRWKIILPEVAQDFQMALIRDFSADVQPFEFEADVIPTHEKKAA